VDEFVRTGIVVKPSSSAMSSHANYTNTWIFFC
jgi:hypothetical protein